LTPFEIELGTVLDALCSRFSAWYPEKAPMAFMHEHYARVLESQEVGHLAMQRLGEADDPPYPLGTPQGLALAVLAATFCRDAQNASDRGQTEAAWAALCMANRLLGMVEGHATGPAQMRVVRQLAGLRGAKASHKDDASERDHVQRWYRENGQRFSNKDRAADYLTGVSGERREVLAKWSTVRRWLKGLK
jgi:hypothetical protein